MKKVLTFIITFVEETFSLYFSSLWTVLVNIMGVDSHLEKWEH